MCEIVAEDFAAIVESGEADLAIGVIPQRGGGFLQERLQWQILSAPARRITRGSELSLLASSSKAKRTFPLTTNARGYEMLEKTLDL